MSIWEDFDEILDYAHMWNWAPDWLVVRDIYKSVPESYSVLTPFAFSYLEELIRSMTSEYGVALYDKEGNIVKKRKVAESLINLAISENRDRDIELIKMLKDLKGYYSAASEHDHGDNRHSVAHGFMHPRYWHKESFETLVHDIALLSKYAGF